jgi:PAS domain S-box-containing protein
MSAFKNNPELKKTIPWKLSIIFFCFSAAIILVGISFYKSQKSRIFTEYKNELTTVATLKIEQIQQWHKERLGDARTLRDNEPLISSVKQYFRDKNKSELKTELTKWMKSICTEYDYSSVALADTLLKIRLAATTSDSITNEGIRKELNEVIGYQEILMTDLKRSGTLKSINMDLLVPLIDPESKKPKTFGVIILRIDPEKVLFPLIQSWPTPSKSSETLLLRKEEDSVLYINELRHRINTALILRLPLTNKNLLASKAAMGQNGVFEGMDYRNVPVVGYLSGVPDFPWFMVAKVDREEILSPLKRYVILIIIVIVLLILINASVFGFWIWNQRAKMYRLQLKDELALRESKDKLHKSEEIFRKLFENMLNGFAYCKMLYADGQPPDFLYINVNKAFELLTGLKHVIGKKVSEVIPGMQDADPELLERYSSVALTGKPEVFETYVESLKMWFSISVYSPQKEYFVAVFDVITLRKQSEEALRESEIKFRQTFDLSPIGIVMVGLDKRFLRCNNSFSQSLGYRVEELVGKTIAEVTYPEDIRIGMDDMMAIAKGELERSHVQKRYLRKDGQIVWGDVLISLIKNNFGDPQYFLSIIQDITESKKIVEALHESEDKFKYIFDHSVIGKSITLPSGEINVNRAFCDMLGYTSEELVRRKWKEISHPDDIDLTQKNLDLLLSGEKNSVRFVKRYIHKNGSVVWTDVGTALRRDENGKALYFMTAVNNITDRKNAESQIKRLNEELEGRVILRTEQLQVANKELEAFSYSVSHDLRAPLRSVHGFTKILLEDYETILDDEGKRICRIISSSATQMGKLIDDLLSFSKIGRNGLNPSEIDMKKMVRQVFEGMTSPSETKRIKLTIGKIHKAFGDVTLLGQVWINLLSNAIKYSSKNEISEISVGSSISDGMITYYIKDKGVGFDMQYVHKLFGVFQRLHSEAEFEGNGVGLAIVQRIIYKHGGKVWAEGNVGKGATFYFSLPIKGDGQAAGGYRQTINQTPNA